jgi:DNA invertase Pin-like site-specific DNA recombinase
MRPLAGIPAQRELLGTYGAVKAFTVLRESIEVETAKQAGRTPFDEMIAFFKKNRNCRTLLVEKTDRLYRNLKDYVTIRLPRTLGEGSIGS